MTKFLSCKDLIQTFKKLDDDVLGQMNAHDFFSNVDITTNYNELVTWVLNNTNVTKVEINKAVKSRKKQSLIIEAIGDVPSDVEHFLQIMANRYTLDIKINGQTFWRLNPDSEVSCLPFSDFKTRIRLDALKLDLPYSIQDIEGAASIYKLNNTMAKKSQIRENLRYDPSVVERAGAVWTDLDAKWFSTEKVPAGFASAMFRKTIWQVKRKMAGIEIENHLMTIVVGPQGVGKSTFIEKLMHPVWDVTSVANFNDIVDKRDHALWGNYLIYMPELEKGDKADMSAVKSAITRKSHNARRMHTNDSDVILNNATFIGDSNQTVAAALYDNTGMRRFGEIELKHDIDVALARASINNADVVELWRSVDETGPDPMLPFAQVLKEQQEEMRAKSAVELWLFDASRDDHRDAPKYGTEWTRLKSMDDLYQENFKPWAKSQSNAILTQRSFSQEMMRIYRDARALHGLVISKSDKLVLVTLKEFDDVVKTPKKKPFDVKKLLSKRG